MIYRFVISTARETDNLINELEQRYAWIKQRGYSLDIKIDVNEQYNMNNILIDLRGNNPDRLFREEDILYIFKHQLSEVLAEHVINYWEDRIIWKEILRRFKSSSSDDKQIIFKKTTEFLKGYNDNESLKLLMNFGRKNKIAHKILDYIYDNDMLVVKGFINFYMRDYLNEIKFALDLAYEELKNEKEYNEFIKLLRYFVDSQPPKTYEVNLLINEDEGFCLWDGNGIKIEESYINCYLEDIMFGEINLDDILISILITIAPRRIILHNTDKTANCEPVIMIKDVFKDRIKTCHGCERCYENKTKTDCEPY